LFACFSFDFEDRVSPCRPGCPQTHDPFASASWELELQVCTTVPF
jgi:hypothetical protein